MTKNKSNAKSKSAAKGKKKESRAQTKGSLSPTDVHFIAGFLYQWAGGGDPKETKITFGDKLLDPTAKKKRDVDVVVFRLRDHMMVGVEVKDHNRPLQLEQVEQLIMKLMSIPDIKERAIISASGYSDTALNKADHFNVKCLRFVRGIPPKYDTTDFSMLKEMTNEGFRWIKPRIRLNIGGLWMESGYTETTKVTLIEKGKQVDAPLIKVIDNMLRQVAQGWTGPVDQPTTQLVNIADKPIIHLAHGTYPILQAEVVGTVTRFKRTIPIKETCYLADRTGAPFASLVLFDVDGTLQGIGSSEGDYHVKLIHLPAELRQCRPTRVSF